MANSRPVRLEQKLPVGLRKGETIINVRVCRTLPRRVDLAIPHGQSADDRLVCWLGRRPDWR